jgi:hypothetical protein
MSTFRVLRPSSTDYAAANSLALVNRLFRAPVVENVMAAHRALRNASSFTYLHLMLALLAAKSASFTHFFTGKDCHIDLQCF